MGKLQDWANDVRGAVTQLPVASVFTPGGAVDQAVTALPLSKSEAVAGSKAAATAFAASGGNPVLAVQAGISAAVAQHAKDQARAEQVAQVAQVNAAAETLQNQREALDATKAQGAGGDGQSGGVSLPVVAGLAIAAKVLFF